MNAKNIARKTMIAGLALMALAAGLSAAPAAGYDWPGENSRACYELSHSPDAWSRTPDLLCVEKNSGRARLTLTSREAVGHRLVGEFYLDLLRGSKDPEINRDAFGLANPSNSVLNALEVSFNGKRVFAMDGGPWYESGTLNIGNNRFFYRLSPR